MLGFLALISKDYMADDSVLGRRTPVEHNANVPEEWIGRLYPAIEQKITGSTYIYYVNWQVFWAMLMSGMILSLAVSSIKVKSTQVTDNHAVQAIAIFMILIGVNNMNAKFGTLGYNPALACA